MSCGPRYNPTAYSGGLIEITRNTVHRLDAVSFGKANYISVDTLSHWFPKGIPVSDNALPEGVKIRIR